MSEPFSVVSCQFLSWTTDGGPGLPHTANTLTFLFHLHACAATEYMRPKVILQAHRGLQSIAATSMLCGKYRGEGEKAGALPRTANTTVRERTARAEPRCRSSKGEGAKTTVRERLARADSTSATEH